MVVFDATFLAVFLDPEVIPEKVGEPRVQHLIATLEKQNSKIIIPTPALSEVLIGAGDKAPEYLDILNSKSVFRIAPFDQRAAVEAAAAHREAIDQQNKKEGSASWPKLKFDRQIVAIAKVAGAKTIYSNDDDISRYSKRDGIQVVRLDDLPRPPENPQHELFKPA